MEQTQKLKESTITRSPRVANGNSLPPQRPLQVGDVMSREPLIAAPHDSIAVAAKRMSEHNVSCLVVVDEDRVVGILTEKDVLKGVAGRDIEFHRLRVSQRMSSPAEVVPFDLSVLEAGRIMEARNIRRLPIVQDGRLVGIVTSTDITRGLISLNPVRYISDIMTPGVATVDSEAKVDEAARIIARQNTSCIIAQHRQEIAGIITEKDILRRVVALHKDPTQSRVCEIMSFPVVAVPPTYSVLSASRKMETGHVHRLVVMENNTICGIVTQTDILRAIRSAFEMVDLQRREMTAQFASLIRNMIQDMKTVQEFLGQAQNPKGGDNTPAGPTQLGAYSIL